MSKWTYKLRLNYSDRMPLIINIDHNIAKTLRDPFLPMPETAIICPERDGISSPPHTYDLHRVGGIIKLFTDIKFILLEETK